MQALIKTYQARVEDCDMRINDVHSRMQTARKDGGRFIALSRQRAVLLAQKHAYAQFLQDLQPGDRSIDHAFNSHAIHDDFSVVNDTLQFSVLRPEGGSQLVRLTRNDIGRMADAMHAVWRPRSGQAAH